MKKVIGHILPIIALIVCAALTLPVAAAEINRGTIRNTCNTLDTFLYPEIYKDQEGYADFQEKLTEAKAATADISLSDEKLTQVYESLRTSYVTLMKNTYDFSGLEEIVAAEENLKKDLYEEETLEAFEKQVESCRNTLSGPALYHINDRSVAEYRVYMQSILDEQENNAVASYNALRLKGLPETIDKESLSSLFGAMKGLTDRLDLSGVASFAAYDEAMKSAETVLNAQNA
ncbi:MAG: hypothetical protein II776_07535, partial [Clostridia bacterium]|nr:hypothetical protein [Clostridia bacterium]